MNPGALVPPDHRVPGEGPLAHMLVGVAQAAVLDPEQDLVRLRGVKVKLDDFPVSAGFEQDRRFRFHPNLRWFRIKYAV